jgi:hypothetical protein
LSPRASSEEPQTPLSRMGVAEGLKGLEALNDMFGLQGVEDALKEKGYTLQEQLGDLIELARNAPMPSDRMRAMKEIRGVLKEVIEANQTSVTLTRKRETTDEHGNRVTEVASFSQRFQGRSSPSSVVSHDVPSDDFDEV